MSRPDRGPKPAAPPKYMNDFSKALAAEVRILLQEVGKLRDEKRALQFEVAELLATKARYGSDGQYDPEWRPHHEQHEAPAPPPPPEPEPEQAGALVLHQTAAPGWRTVPKKVERKPRQPKARPAPPPEPAPPPPPPVQQPNLPSWASWKPNPIYHPQPRAAAPPTPSGLFGGPPTPPL